MPIGTWNQNPRPLLDSFQYYESNDNLRIGKWVFIENHIFRDNHYYLGLCKISILSLDHLRTMFWKTSISLDSCWLVRFNFKLRLLFWTTTKNLTFWIILPLGRNFGIGAHEQLWTNREYGCVCIKGRNSNTQLVMGFQ